MSDDDIHQALRQLCTEVGSIKTSVCDLQRSMETGRHSAIQRHAETDQKIGQLTQDVSDMKPHVEQFVRAKKHIIRASILAVLTSFGLNTNEVASVVGKLFGWMK